LKQQKLKPIRLETGSCESLVLTTIFLDYTMPHRHLTLFRLSTQFAKASLTVLYKIYNTCKIVVRKNGTFCFWSQFNVEQPELLLIEINPYTMN
jgi:hypothetical protein